MLSAFRDPRGCLDGVGSFPKKNEGGGGFSSVNSRELQRGVKAGEQAAG